MKQLINLLSSTIFGIVGLIVIIKLLVIFFLAIPIQDIPFGLGNNVVPLAPSLSIYFIYESLAKIGIFIFALGALFSLVIFFFGHIFPKNISFALGIISTLFLTVGIWTIEPLRSTRQETIILLYFQSGQPQKIFAILIPLLSRFLSFAPPILALFGSIIIILFRGENNPYFSRRSIIARLLFLLCGILLVLIPTGYIIISSEMMKKDFSNSILRFDFAIQLPKYLPPGIVQLSPASLNVDEATEREIALIKYGPIPGKSIPSYPGSFSIMEKIFLPKIDSIDKSVIKNTVKLDGAKDGQGFFTNRLTLQDDQRLTFEFVSRTNIYNKITSFRITQEQVEEIARLMY